ncbi:hypothetical protein [Nocardia carnea]|uniref:hypothetical protein n=1 Tax=Nocardia carnea TaxID=37328 RepID=UPI0024581A79|nr:hypothetical protein [Nocardia carnea]
MALSPELVSEVLLTLPERFYDRIPDADLRCPVALRNLGGSRGVVSVLLFLLDEHHVTVTSLEHSDLSDLAETFWPAGEHRIAGQGTAAGAGILSRLPITPSLSEDELAVLLENIPARFRGRLPERRLKLLTPISEDFDAKCYLSMVDDLVATLHRYRTPITDHERADIALMLDAVREPRLRLTQLPVKAPLRTGTVPLC